MLNLLLLIDYLLAGVCMENRNIDEDVGMALQRGQKLEDKLSQDSPTSASSSSFSSSIYKVALTQSLGGSKLVVAVVCLCITSIVIFVLVFVVLQARSSEHMCWTSRYQPVPTFYQNGTDKVSVLNKDEDLADEDEAYTA